MNELDDKQMMMLMAFADGELQGDELAQVQALIERDEGAAAMVAGMNTSRQALQLGVVELEPTRDLSAVVSDATDEVAALQLMTMVDGELSDEQRVAARIDELLAGSSAAQTWVNDLRIAGRALHDATLSDSLAPAWSKADLSMVRGRVMTRLPMQERAPAVDAEPAGPFATLIAWFGELGWGKTAMAGAMLAAALLLAVSVQNARKGEPSVLDNRPVMSEHPGARPADGEPEVIIEDMETGGGTVIMQGGENSGEPMIIWHIDSERGDG